MHRSRTSKNERLSENANDNGRNVVVSTRENHQTAFSRPIFNVEIVTSFPPTDNARSNIAHNTESTREKERRRRRRRRLIYNDIIGFINLYCSVPKGTLFSRPEIIFSRPTINCKNVTPRNKYLTPRVIYSTQSIRHVYIRIYSIQGDCFLCLCNREPEPNIYIWGNTFRCVHCFLESFSYVYTPSYICYVCCDDF